MVVVTVVYVVAVACLAFNRTLEEIWRYLRRADRRPPAAPDPLTAPPLVTIQLPVYNEFYVVERLIDSCCAIEYPKDRLQIQVLDDSTDETTGLIAGKVRAYLEQGVDIVHLRRGDRTGYKAGNLQHGLATATGDFIAIFDADCVPNRDFLRQTLPYFADAEVGIVFPRRVRHLNRGRSLLTRAQDPFGHLVPPPPSAHSGHHFNFFFGSPGLVRRTCLMDVGGWQGDTLCEDEDFSLRSYLRGWRCVGLEAIMASDEVAERIDEVKGQFNRWKKGNAENYRKHITSIFRSATLPARQKLAVFAAIHAPWFHIPVITIIVAVSVPMLLVGQPGPMLRALLVLPSALTVLWFFGIVWLRNPTLVASLLLNFGLFPRVTWSVFEGALGIKTPFVRSAKTASATAGQHRTAALYEVKAGPAILVEAVAALYALLGLVFASRTGRYWLAPFHLLCAASFAFVFVLSVRESLPALTRGNGR